MEQNNGKVSITFSGSASPYHEGDVASFPAGEARQYVDKGVAAYTSEEDAEAAVPPAAPVVASATRAKGAAKAPAKAPAAKPGPEAPPPGDGQGAGGGEGGKTGEGSSPAQ